MGRIVRLRPYTSRPSAVAQFSGNRVEVLEETHYSVRVKLPNNKAAIVTPQEIREIDAE